MNHSPTNVKVLRLVREQRKGTDAIIIIWRTTMESIGSKEAKWWLDGYEET